MSVCLSVRNRFTIEIYGFTHSLCPSLVRATHDAIMIDVKVLRIEDNARRVQRYMKTVNCCMNNLLSSLKRAVAQELKSYHIVCSIETHG